MGGKALWPIPANVNPADSRCLVIRVPNDPQHIANFFGALYELTLWLNYDRDEAHRGKDAAAVWWEIYRNLLFGDCATIGGDDMQFRQNGCRLEFSLDCVTWHTLYDPTNCIKTIAGQRSPGLIVNPGACQEFDITIQANQKYLLPVMVSAGWSIEISDASGAWSDGTTAWNCPDGTTFVLGHCFGSQGHVGGDPSATAFHMEVIADVAGDAIYPASSGTITIPGGVSDAEVTLYANDSDLSNNSGSVALHIKVCAATSVYEWCVLYLAGAGKRDLTVPGSALALNLGVYNAAADTVDGEGFGANSNELASADVRWSGATDVRHVRMVFDGHGHPSAGDNSAEFYDVNGVVFATTLIHAADNFVGEVMEWTGSRSPTDGVGCLVTSYTPSGAARIKYLLVEGNGPPPLGIILNC